ncbi:MAG TPA: zinc ribbon domain-containing protein [Bacillota bacterium]|nr:zinc ribbon domain-containing protein [Bacillota bacterium]HOL09337.1 zinc ribbon domain-containing protein [Bacillota bacterium]HPO97632.1 zinc ribbon domain-containing protein [Bacillota bacterium]
MNHNFCQSCGMPLNATSLYGSEQNGVKNEEYCIYCYCYENGQFKQPFFLLLFF